MYRSTPITLLPLRSCCSFLLFYNLCIPSLLPTLCLVAPTSGPSN